MSPQDSERPAAQAWRAEARELLAAAQYCNGSKQTKRLHDRLVGHGATDVDVAQRSAELDRLHARFAGRFARSEPRRRARQYLSPLVAGLDRTNYWTLAEQAGDISSSTGVLPLSTADPSVAFSARTGVVTLVLFGNRASVRRQACSPPKRAPAPSQPRTAPARAGEPVDGNA